MRYYQTPENIYSPEDPHLCAVQLNNTLRTGQCPGKSGHGESGELCKLHAEMNTLGAILEIPPATDPTPKPANILLRTQSAFAVIVALSLLGWSANGVTIFESSGHFLISGIGAMAVGSVSILAGKYLKRLF